MSSRTISRRHLLKLFGSAGLAPALKSFSTVSNSPRHLTQAPTPHTTSLPKFAFEEISPAKSGISWSHTAGLSSDMYLPETVGTGCAFLDYDNDGWLDIYLVNSGPCDFFAPARPLRNALYRNNRDGTFTDVTAQAGVPGNAYGMGVAVGDYNSDGFPDLFVTQYPRSILYRNNGDGTFTDVTEKAGLACPGWATSAVWFDYDNDGRLDLFVCRFVDFSKSKNVYCGYGASNTRWYCKPNVYPPMPCWLFHNNGDGTFTDISASSGISKSPAKAWGVVAADINNDGRQDLFVGNDTVPNFLLANRGKGRFEEIGGLAGVAFSNFGLARSGMGVDAADYDQDGFLDLAVTNVDHESYSLYHNSRDESFTDAALKTGIASATRLMSGWGLKFFDFDNDGNLDLLIANGHPDTMVEQRLQEVTYKERLLLFRNTGSGFEDVSARSGSIFEENFAARGLALGDFDNDGAVDALITVNDGPPVLLRNQSAQQNHWLGLRLVGKTANVDAIGAKIVWQAGDLRRHVFKVGGGSYLSAHDPRIVLGLGPHATLESLEIQWPRPSTRIDRFTNLPSNRYLTVIEGQAPNE